MKAILLLCALLALLLNTACSVRLETPPKKVMAAASPLTAPLTPTITVAAPQTASFCYEGDGIALTLPADWDYEITAHDAEIGQFSIAVWPKAQPEAQLELIHYATPFGVCGTGLHTQEVAFSSGLTGSMGTYEDLDSWSYIAFEGDYVALNQGIGLWWDVYGVQAMEILGSAVFGEEAAG